MLWAHIVAILALVSRLYLRRNRPRDLFRGPPAQSAVSGWTRLAGIGLAFGALPNAVVLLRNSTWQESWASDLTFWIAGSLVGLTIWFDLSEVDPEHAEPPR
jgi:hypothetical protein